MYFNSNDLIAKPSGTDVTAEGTRNGLNRLRKLLSVSNEVELQRGQGDIPPIPDP